MVSRWSVAVAGLLLVPSVAACSSDGPKAAPTATATPLSKLHVSSLRLARAEFCDQVPKSAVRRALGADPSSDASWGNGDPVDGEDGTGDIGHEIGCSWNSTQAAARAWVFARPVTSAFAADLVRQPDHGVGCTTTPTTDFGSPSVLQSCRSPRGVLELRRAGLFGDTWVTCEVSNVSTPRARLDAFCAQVVAALDASGGSG
jgi:hypothetical protein